MSKNFKIKKTNNCEICKDVKVKRPAKTCQSCNRAMAVVNTMLEKEIGVSPSHDMYPEYMGAVFASLKEKKNTLRNITGDKISFLSMAILESTEAHEKHRTKANYTRYMVTENVIRACFHDDNGRLPTDEEFQQIKTNIGKDVEQ